MFCRKNIIKFSNNFFNFKGDGNKWMENVDRGKSWRIVRSNCEGNCQYAGIRVKNLNMFMT
jgi:hypothetical protein